MVDEEDKLYIFTFTFTFREFGRRFYPKQLTKSTLVEKQQYIAMVDKDIEIKMDSAQSTYRHKVKHVLSRCFH